MNQKLNVTRKKVAIMTILLFFASMLFVNVNVFSKNAEALDSGTILCVGGGSLDCRGFAAKLIIWIY
jgi:hypothetical protein